MKLFVRGLLVIILLVLSLGAWYLSRPVAVTNKVVVYIPVSSSSARATRILVDAGVVSQPTVLRTVLGFVAKASGKGLHRGSYAFTPDDTYWQVMKSLVFGDRVLTIRVTFPEGITLRRFASIIRSRIGVDSVTVMRHLLSDSLRQAWGAEASSVEGYLMPDTYEFYSRQPVEEVIDRLLKQQRDVWEKRFARQAMATGMSKHELLTLASIVESETSVDTERSRIAGVYMNRLRQGMRLAADPTVQYALGGQARRLLYKDLEVDDPYNTYRYAGLPPGPICAPGAASIEAAIAPERHGFLYFCARGDGSGLHSFAASGAEHARNVSNYRRSRRK